MAGGAIPACLALRCPARALAHLWATAVSSCPASCSPLEYPLTGRGHSTATARLACARSTCSQLFTHSGMRRAAQGGSTGPWRPRSKFLNTLRPQAQQRAQLYLLALPLVGLEAIDPALPRVAAVHRALALSQQGQGYALWDFLPAQPTSPLTAAALLAGSSVPGVTRRRPLARLPPRRAAFLGVATLAEKVGRGERRRALTLQQPRAEHCLAHRRTPWPLRRLSRRPGTQTCAWAAMTAAPLCVPWPLSSVGRQSLWARSSGTDLAACVPAGHTALAPELVQYSLAQRQPHTCTSKPLSIFPALHNKYSWPRPHTGAARHLRQTFSVQAGLAAISASGCRASAALALDPPQPQVLQPYWPRRSRLIC